MDLAENNQNWPNGSLEHIHELRKALGKVLAEHRLSKGVSVAEIEANTKISSIFINAIENGSFELLPGRVFGRGFIKNICSMLELDHNPILSDYDKAWAEPVQEKKQARWQSWRLASQEPRKTFSPDRPRFSYRHLFIVFNIAIVLGVVILASRLLSDRFFRQTPPITNSETQVQAQVPESQIKQPPPEAAPVNIENKVETQNPSKKDESSITSKLTKKNKADSSPKDEAEQKTADTRPTVIINVKESVVIKHRVLPNDYVTTTYAPGAYRFPIDDRIDFEVLDAESVDIIFNDKSLGVLGKKGEQRKLTFYAKELQEDLANSEPDMKKM